MLVASDDAPAARPRQGSCYGFDIHATIPLACLRNGGGTPMEIDTVAPLEPDPPPPMIAEWTEAVPETPYARLHGSRDEYWLWMNRVGWTRVRPRDQHITLPAFLHPAVREEWLWTTPVSLCLLERGDLALHAAAIEVNGEAVLIVASGNAGKSTLAAAFVRAGYRLLSEDITCLRIDGVPSVIPGPAMLRLRRDVVPHVVLPRARVIREVHSRVTLALDEAVRGRCDPVPVRTVYMLEAVSATPRKTHLPPAAGIQRLWPMVFTLPLKDCTARSFGHLCSLAAGTPIWSFTRPARLEELPRAVEDLIG